MSKRVRDIVRRTPDEWPAAIARAGLGEDDTAHVLVEKKNGDLVLEEVYLLGEVRVLSAPLHTFRNDRADEAIAACRWFAIARVCRPSTPARKKKPAK